MDSALRTLRLGGETFLLRPYVFAFLLCYLLLAVPAWGWRRTALYAALGYALAFAAEYSSIHDGIPFGLYAYVSEPTRGRELWVAGVPFMDSLSFVFLSFAGLQTARLLLAPPRRGVWRWQRPERLPDWREWLLGGLLTMGLDVVIDPLALQGERWFLGRIYYYPGGGPYFGVPLANFAGWALVAWAIIGLFLLFERLWLRRALGPWRGYPLDALGGAALFAAVLAFNLAVTFAIGEPLMGLTGLLWSALMLGAVAARVGRRGRATPGAHPARRGTPPR